MNMRKHISVIILFIAVSLIWVIAAEKRGVEDLNSDQQYILNHSVKHFKPELYKNDLLYKDDVAISYMPWYINYLGWAYISTGNLMAGYKFLLLPLNFIYLIGAYLIFKEITNKKWTSAVLAFFSSTPLSVPIAGEYFGIGPLQMLTARSIFTAFFPYLMLIFYKWIDMPNRLFVLFFLTGLLINIHPPSGLFLTEIFLIAIFFMKPINIKNTAYIFGYSVSMFIGSFYLFYLQFKRLKTQISGFMEVSQSTLKEVFDMTAAYLFYPPHTLSFIPLTFIHIITFILIVASIAFLLWVRKGRISNPIALTIVAFNLFILLYLLYSEIKNYIFLLVVMVLFSRKISWDRTAKLTVSFGIIVFLVSIGGMLIVQNGLSLFDIPPLFIDQIRGSRFAGFYIYMLFALVLKEVDKESFKGFKKGIVITLAVFVMFMSLRHTYRTYITFRPNVLNKEMALIAQWAKKNIAQDEVIMTDSLAFRLISERAIFVCKKDGPAFYYSYPERASEWLYRFRTFNNIKNDSKAIIRIAMQYGISYIILRKADTEQYQNIGITVYQTDNLSMIKI